MKQPVPVSCMKAMNGARPVPGPTIMTGTRPSRGRWNWGFRLIDTGEDWPRFNLSLRYVVATPVLVFPSMLYLITDTVMHTVFAS